MNPDPITIGDQPIQRLERIVSAICQAARLQGKEKEKVRNALRAALAGECPCCGIRVTGEELLELLEVPPLKETNVRIARLRKGRCANQHCEFTSYRLILGNHPDLDWAKLLAPGEARPAGDGPIPEVDTAVTSVISVPLHRRTAFRVGVAITAGILLILLRQWYLGGGIPLIMEPEKFRVDPLPAGAETNELGNDSPPH
jgi:hypothetical protein